MSTLHAGAEAGFWSTRCAGRELDQAYANPQAVALVKAATRGRVEQVARLAAATPGLVNTVEEGSVPPLMWAICADNVEGFEALLKAGADPNLGGSGSGRGDSKGHGNKENGSLIRKGWSATLLAAGSGNPAFLRLAIRHGGDVNAAKGIQEGPGKAGPTRPLLLAAFYGLFENIKTLAAAGADINVREGITYAPVEAIAVGGRFDIAVWLLQQGYNNNLPRLGRSAEGSHVPLDSEQQRWKEILIGMLRERGVVFPSLPRTLLALKERDIPAGEVDDIVRGRKNVNDYPLKAPRRQ